MASAFGEYSIERLPLRWIVLQGEGEKEFALEGHEPKVIVHPYTSVRYRIEDRKTDFIGALYESLVHLRESARQEN